MLLSVPQNYYNSLKNSYGAMYKVLEPNEKLKFYHFWYDSAVTVSCPCLSSAAVRVGVCPALTCRIVP